MGRLKCTAEAFSAEAVDMTVKCPDRARIKKILIAFSAAPTTSEDLTVTLDSAKGSDYDATIYTVDPVSEGVSSAMQIVFDDDEGDFAYGDAIAIAYDNTDDADIGVSVYYEVMP